jgi:hypothetical protein
MCVNWAQRRTSYGQKGIFLFSFFRPPQNFLMSLFLPTVNGKGGKWLLAAGEMMGLYTLIKAGAL